MTNFDLSETDRLLTTTRSVRKRLDLEKPVPRDVHHALYRTVDTGADRLEPAALAVDGRY